MWWNLTMTSGALVSVARPARFTLTMSLLLTFAR
jgi:hypothetical protein